jgi:hypothetical protein
MLRFWHSLSPTEHESAQHSWCVPRLRQPSAQLSPVAAHTHSSSSKRRSRSVRPVRQMQRCSTEKAGGLKPAFASHRPPLSSATMSSGSSNASGVRLRKRSGCHGKPTSEVARAVSRSARLLSSDSSRTCLLLGRLRRPSSSLSSDADSSSGTSANRNAARPRARSTSPLARASGASAAAAPWSAHGCASSARDVAQSAQWPCPSVMLSKTPLAGAMHER